MGFGSKGNPSGSVAALKKHGIDCTDALFGEFLSQYDGVPSEAMADRFYEHLGKLGVAHGLSGGDEGARESDEGERWRAREGGRERVAERDRGTARGGGGDDANQGVAGEGGGDAGVRAGGDGEDGGVSGGADGE